MTSSSFTCWLIIFPLNFNLDSIAFCTKHQLLLLLLLYGRANYSKGNKVQVESTNETLTISLAKGQWTTSVTAQLCQVLTFSWKECVASNS